MESRESKVARESGTFSRGPNCHLSIVGPCKVILDSGFHVMPSSEFFQALDARFLVRGTPIVRFQIP